MKIASRKLSTFAPDLLVRGVGMQFAIADMCNPILTPVQTGREGNFATL
ncbi:MAG: hypothetical protein ABI607_00565 [Betaproteobacteria bacterium]